MQVIYTDLHGVRHLPAGSVLLFAVMACDVGNVAYRKHNVGALLHPWISVLSETDVCAGRGRGCNANQSAALATNAYSILIYFAQQFIR